MATMLILLLQVNSSRKHEQKEEKKKKADEANKSSGGDGSGEKSGESRRLGMSNITAVSTPGQEEALGGELLATEGVSLG